MFRKNLEDFSELNEGLAVGIIWFEEIGRTGFEGTILVNGQTGAIFLELGKLALRNSFKHSFQYLIELEIRVACGYLDRWFLVGIY